MTLDGEVSFPRVLVFARLPQPGRCKTRLAAGVGAASACRVYEALLLRCVVAAAEFGEYEVHAADEGDVAGLAAWLAARSVPDAAVVAQAASPDLGARLHAAFTQTLSPAAAGATPSGALLVGSDVPGLDCGTLRAAAACLRSGADVVLGPSHDGGFYLIGVRAPPPPALFEGVRWSTRDARGDVGRNAARLGLRVSHELPTLRDIDTRDDLAAWRGGAGEGRGDASELGSAADAALLSSDDR